MTVRNPGSTGGYNRCVAITLSDTVSIAGGLPDAVLVTTAGNFVYLDSEGNTTTLTGATAGLLLRVKVSRINVTGTTGTASALYY